MGLLFGLDYCRSIIYNLNGAPMGRVKRGLLELPGDVLLVATSPAFASVENDRGVVHSILEATCFLFKTAVSNFVAC